MSVGSSVGDVEGKDVTLSKEGTMDGDDVDVLDEGLCVTVIVGSSTGGSVGASEGKEGVVDGEVTAEGKIVDICVGNDTVLGLDEWAVGEPLGLRLG